MTQTTDPTIDQLRTWLAEQPCPCLVSMEGYDVLEMEVWEKKLPVPNCQTCQGTGRALPWASKPCPRKPSSDGHRGCGSCVNGSGRVPKAVGLADIVLAVPYGVWSFVGGEDDWFCTLTIYSPGGDEEADPHVFKGTDPDLTLAALRAVAAKAGTR